MTRLAEPRGSGLDRASPDTAGEPLRERAVSAFDALAVLGFLVFAFLFQMANFSDRPPYVLLDDDAGNIATFAAARDHPELFEGDEVLGTPRIALWYPTIHVALIRLLSRITGDYGTAFQSLLGLHVFLQAAGFYLLGRVVFQSRYWAFLLAAVTLFRVDLNLGEFWGVYKNPIPRVTFQALLPFLATAAYYWRATPRFWPAIIIGASLLMYVHPVSAPAWAVAFWLGFAACLPSTWSWARSSTALLGLGALFLVVTIPFLWHYVGNQEVGTATNAASYDRTYRIIEARFLPGYLDLPRAFADFVLVFTAIRGRKFFWVWASLAALLLLALRRTESRSVVVVLAWMLGILVTSTVLPLIDHEVARRYRSLPLEYDLVRGLRYLVPLALLISLWPLSEWSRRSSRLRPAGPGGVALAIAGALLVSIWAYWHPPFSMTSVVPCWSRGRIACGPRTDDAFEALQAIRELTPPRAGILPTDLPLQIRYFSLRPVVHCQKDGGILAYTDHQALLKWDERRQALSSAMGLPDAGSRLQGLVDLASSLGARYLFVDAGLTEGDSPARFDVVWANERYALVEIHSSRTRR